ncbi:VanW family protein [Clostridium estertheticum]|uniref:VanW family protein n=1 Tax=Clostridium estertheticum TaxID=238834 RepID=UPI001CF3E7D8|nr:VanW family protein [Clostridium estertheticum]MCB2305161.1 VanW family protein [Clostridium estertheticum]MCB2343569.1 VanW family protein [Clostridium estertheticum]MCB2348489.1 VanW family protein [Clostridium estertheticum]WAG47436.1 VanW family protein [Clostridium estertheticum]
MKKKAIIIIGVLILFSTFTFSGYSYIRVKYWDSLILPGVKIGNEDLTGKTRKEAQTIINDKYASDVMKKKITIVTDEKKYIIDYKMVEAKYNVDQAVEQALTYGKDRNMFQKYKAITHPVSKQIKLTFEYNDKAVDKILKGIAKEIDKKAKNATITKESGGEFVVTNDVIGKQLEVEKLKNDIKSKIDVGVSKDDAYIKAAVKDIKPKISEAALKTVNTRISRYTTNFGSSSEDRATNIALATGSINGKLLMPGDVFSFNDVVGERTALRGYKAAGVIIGDKLEQGLGGGICQVSSTLYNAMLSTSIVSVERIHHTISSGYIPKGQDATVDYGNLDYKFKNTFEYPIYIEGFLSNGNIHFNIYSNSTLTKRTYEIVNEVSEPTDPKTETIKDPTMYQGQSEIVKTGYAGFKVKVTRKTYENGKLVNTEIINQDTFHVINEVKKVGTKR